MTVTFEDSGKGSKVNLTLDDVRSWAVEYGFVKTNVAADKPIAQRVDLVAFFNVYKTSAFSVFKQKFKSKRLKPPNEDQQDEDEIDEDLSEEEIATMLSEYEEYKDYESLKWKYVKRPGGQAIRPEPWYTCYGTSQYLSEGEVKDPAPVWREDGSIDYGGRAKWDAWNACKGMSVTQAKITFVKAMREAKANPKDNFF